MPQNGSRNVSVLKFQLEQTLALNLAVAGAYTSDTVYTFIWQMCSPAVIGITAAQLLGEPVTVLQSVLLFQKLSSGVGWATFFFRPLHPQDTYGVRAPRPPGHVSALINPPHYGPNMPWPPGQVAPPNHTPRTHFQQPPPHRTKKCLRPTHPPRIISGTALRVRSLSCVPSVTLFLWVSEPEPGL